LCNWTICSSVTSTVKSIDVCLDVIVYSANLIVVAYTAGIYSVFTIGYLLYSIVYSLDTESISSFTGWIGCTRAVIGVAIFEGIRGLNDELSSFLLIFLFGFTFSFIDSDKGLMS